MTMTHAARYDVEEAIGRLLDSGETADPRAIAEQVAGAIPPEQLRSTLANALVLIVQRTIHGRRNASRGKGATGQRPGSSDPLDALLCVAHGRWKQLRQCTAVDLRSVVRWQDRRLTVIAGERDIYEALAGALDRDQVHTVDDLDPVLALHLLS